MKTKFVSFVLLLALVCLSAANPSAMHASAAKPTSVLPSTLGTVRPYVSHSGFSLVPPKGWKPTAGIDPNSGYPFDVFQISLARLIVIWALPPGAKETDMTNSITSQGHKVTRLSKHKVMGKQRQVYTYHDNPGDQPPYQMYAVVMVAESTQTLYIALGSDPKNYKADLKTFLTVLDTMKVSTL